MEYGTVVEGRFLARPNRFIAHVETAQGVQVCHVKNTGRCQELLPPGARVFLEDRQNPGRKTRYDLIAVEKAGLLINMDSQAPNKAAGEWLAAGELLPQVTLLRPECRFGGSRFDFYLETPEEKAFLEVKGVTLEENRVVMFPDAPTQRGVKHVQELCACLKAGYRAYLLFVIQMEGARLFRPNWATHPAFGQALLEAREQGVRILARECHVTPGSMTLGGPVPLDLERPREL